jgi:phospholipid/cholesterol/gamma-HCH transport system ATP-binding protein
LRMESHSTLLTVTNDMQRAYQIGDRICLLAQKKLTEGGTPQQIRDSEDPGIRQFIYGLKNGPLTSELA